MSSAPPDSSTPADAPPPEKKSLVDKLGAALPIGLTALATVFAGMSSAALQQAMYWKGQAGQDQSKSTNQWTLAGFKRDRAMMMELAAAQMRAAAGYPDAKGLIPEPKPADGTDDPKKTADAKAAVAAYGWLTKPADRPGEPPAGGLPAVKLPDLADDHIRDLRKGIEERHPEAELIRTAGKVKIAAINKVLDDAEKANEQIDREWSPVLDAAGRLAAAGGGKPDKEKAAGRQAVGYELQSRRYRAESRLNQELGFLYEVKVKVSSAESDKHRKKSEILGYAMLVAQIGAVVSSLALARKSGMSLWLVAGLAGLFAICVGAVGFGVPGMIGIAF